MIFFGFIKSTAMRMALLASFAVGIGLSAPALALDAADKTEIEDILRNYLLKNPELLIEMQQSLEVKRKSEALARAKKAISEKSDLIFSSKNQFSIGAKNGDVTVVEFFDYNCPFCKRAMGDMLTLLKNDKKLNFVMKELPILSEGSVQAHRVSTALGRMAPEKYAEYHERLMNAPGQKNGDRALQIAGQMGIDVNKLRELAKDESINDAFREVNQLSTDLGISGTPSYVIGNEVIFGALGAAVLSEKIANMRKCGSTTCS